MFCSFYGFVRTQNAKGVTIPSQRRWVYYYEEFLQLQSQGLDLPVSRQDQVTKLFISSGAPKFDTIVIRCDTNNLKLSSLKWKNQWRISSAGGEWLNLEPLRIFLTKDVRVLFKSKNLLRKQSSVFSFWFNTQFVKHGYLRLSKEGLDKVNKKKKVADFYIEVFFDNYDAEKVKVDMELNVEAMEKRRHIINNMKAHFDFEGSDISSESADAAAGTFLAVDSRHLSSPSIAEEDPPSIGQYSN